MADRWTVGHSLVQGANYDRLSGSTQYTRLAEGAPSFVLYPFYWAFKIRLNGSAPDKFMIRFYPGNGKLFAVDVYPDKIKNNAGQQHLADMTVPHVIELLILGDSTNGKIFLDGVEVLALTPSGGAAIFRFELLTSTPFIGSFDYLWQRIHRKPISLVDYFWLEFLQARVMDPADRDDPADFIKQRYPVETFPTEIQKPIIDFFISHRPRPRFHPSFPHTYLASEVTINAYVGIDYEFEGLKNISLLNSMMSLIVEALGSVYDDIPVLRNYTFSSPRFFLDERNKAWRGVLKVTADHFVEVF